MEVIKDLVLGIVKAGMEAAAMSESEALAHLDAAIISTRAKVAAMKTKIAEDRAQLDAERAAKSAAQ